MKFPETFSGYPEFFVERRLNTQNTLMLAAEVHTEGKTMLIALAYSVQF